MLSALRNPGTRLLLREMPREKRKSVMGVPVFLRTHLRGLTMVRQNGVLSQAKGTSENSSASEKT